jgi:hypothetical protein
MTRGSKKKKETFQITSKIHKELQNVIIWVCFDKCYQNKRMSDVARKQMVYDLYYGKKDKPDEMTFVDVNSFKEWVYFQFYSTKSPSQQQT